MTLCTPAVLAVLACISSACGGGQRASSHRLSTDRRQYRAGDVVRIELEGPQSADEDLCDAHLQKLAARRWMEVPDRCHCGEGPVVIGTATTETAVRRLAGLSGGTYRFALVWRSGREVVSAPFEVAGPADGIDTGGDLPPRMIPEAGGGRLTGRVVDRVTGKPVREAVVAAGEVSAAVDADGRFELAVPPATYTLFVHLGSSGEAFARANLPVVAGHRTEVNVRLVPPCD